MLPLGRCAPRAWLTRPSEWVVSLALVVARFGLTLSTVMNSTWRSIKDTLSKGSATPKLSWSQG